MTLRAATVGTFPERFETVNSGLQASQVSTDLLNAYITKYRKAGLKTATLNREMSALKRAFNLGYNCTPRKVQQVPVFPKRLEEAAPRKGFVTQSQYNKMAANAGSLWMRALLATGYAFGFRRGELVSMRVKQIDLIERTITLYRGETKSGEPRLVKMTNDVFVLLQACVQDKTPEQYVFTRKGEPISDTREAWAAMCVKAGLGKYVCAACGHEAKYTKANSKCSCGKALDADSLQYKGFIFHDLRRSALRNMIRRGIPERVAMAISGHRTRAVFDRCNIVSTNDLAEAAKKIEAGQNTQAEIDEMHSGINLVKVEPTYGLTRC